MIHNAGDNCAYTETFNCSHCLGSLSLICIFLHRCMLHNFGGNEEMYGRLDTLGVGPIEALTSPNSTMVGAWKYSTISVCLRNDFVIVFPQTKKTKWYFLFMQTSWWQLAQPHELKYNTLIYPVGLKVGVGTCMEGIEQNPVVYELMGEMSFQNQPVEMEVSCTKLLWVSY